MKNPITDVTSTWINHAINELFPRSLIILGLSSIPTIKSKKLIPIFENDWNAVLPWSNPGKKILINVPAIIYQIIIGWRKSFIIPIVTSTMPRTTLSEINTSWDIESKLRGWKMETCVCFSLIIWRNYNFVKFNFCFLLEFPPKVSTKILILFLYSSTHGRKNYISRYLSLLWEHQW